jgi:hypothetical protein
MEYETRDWDALSLSTSFTETFFRTVVVTCATYFNFKEYEILTPSPEFILAFQLGHRTESDRFPEHN